MNKISWEADALCSNQSLDAASEDASVRGHWHPFKCRLHLELQNTEPKLHLSQDQRAFQLKFFRLGMNSHTLCFFF